jgi:hypothetical protein
MAFRLFCIPPRPVTSKYNVKPTSQYNSILLNTVKPVLRGHRWDKENVAL